MAADPCPTPACRAPRTSGPTPSGCAGSPPASWARAALADDVAQEAWTAAVAHPPAAGGSLALLAAGGAAQLRAGVGPRRPQPGPARVGGRRAGRGELALVRGAARAPRGARLRRRGGAPVEGALPHDRPALLRRGGAAQRDRAPPGAARRAPCAGASSRASTSSGGGIEQRYGGDRRAWLAWRSGRAAGAGRAGGRAGRRGGAGAGCWASRWRCRSGCRSPTRRPPRARGAVAQRPAGRRRSPACRARQGWPGKTAPLLVEAQLPDEVAPNDRLSRM